MVVGNVVEDRAPDGRWVPGGPSLYSAHMAKSLGASVTLVTCELVSAGPGSFDRSVLDGLDVIELPRADGKPMPRYANEYDAAGNRTQLLLERGDDLAMADFMPAHGHRFAGAADVLLYAPAFHELTTPPATPIPARITAVALQGFLRNVDARMCVQPHAAPMEQAGAWLDVADFAFLSEEDTADAPGFAREAARRHATIFLTRGYRGADVFVDGGVRQFDALPANTTDPTGAGDCFSTAFLVRFAETGDFDEACRFGLAAGSLAVEGPGLSAVPLRARIEQRLRQVAA